jgi:putative membrane protein
MVGFVLRAVIAALGLWLAAYWIPGIRVANPGTLLLAGILLGIVNAIVRPIAVILTLPLTVLTLGLFLLVVNGLMLALVALLLPGFHIATLWDAILGALIVSVTGWIGHMLIKPRSIARI